MTQATEQDLTKARDLRSPHVNAVLDELQRYRDRDGEFRMQYGAVTIEGIHDLTRVLVEFEQRGKLIEQLRAAMDKEIHLKRKYRNGLGRIRGFASKTRDGEVKRSSLNTIIAFCDEAVANG